MPNPYVLLDKLNLNAAQLKLLREHALDAYNKAKDIRELTRTVHLAAGTEFTRAAYCAAQNEACDAYSYLGAIDGHIVALQGGYDDGCGIQGERLELSEEDSREQARLGEGDFLHDQEVERAVFGDSGVA